MVWVWMCSVRVVSSVPERMVWVVPSEVVVVGGVSSMMGNGGSII